MQSVKAGTRPPWVGFAAAVWVGIAAGNSYCFPLYSHALKSVLGFTQQQLTVLGVANDLGENTGILPGIACNYFPPWVVLLVGVFSSFFGYGVIWLAITQTVQNLPYWILWIALVLAANSSAWLGTAVIVTNLRNFPLSRGTVAGLLKGYIALSAAVFTEISIMLFNGSASAVVLLFTLGIPVICLALMYYVRPCTPAFEPDPSENGHFMFTQGTSLLLAIFLLTTTILKNTLNLNNTTSYTFIAIMVVFLLSPLAVPIKMTLFPARKTGIQPVESSEGLDSKTAPLLTPSSSNTTLASSNEDDDVSYVNMLLALGEGAIKSKKRRPRRGEDFSFREAVVKADFWLLWATYFFGIGSGVTVLNNLAQIAASVGFEDTSTLMSLFSFCNFLGRLGGGAVSEYFVRLNATPRTFWTMVTQVIMVLTYLLYASSLDGTLYAATALLGTCYGLQIAIMISTTSELFGLKNFGIFFNFMQLGNPLGAVFLSGMLAGYIYDTEAAKQGGTTCVGPACFRLTFLVLACVCGLGTILSLILTLRIRPVYQMLYAGGSFRLPQSSVH
ncbi:putative major facilitator superfamily domain, MFS transporter superfamily [Helianthus annuus]|uniref:Major facilitator superfamily domain, MFS transporter superfamily n=1 Tax=Helianthus annuus TaxID=4232 RepID=A0A251UU34_HELAN|nr:protein NUCLEAR FUSION DEFECTIVE 4 [Helianthus annuus]KAF5806847.1 putative major facilitator superfamily domain, MFS transporter superfamily [Helianthus annuus]KAJ0585405.1 putative MFS transporter superfamily [Helianthus annuus]KAJ0923643.1 putative major facilitator superfamily domain, MFS transporter superfamily [Helianthus annuus]